MTRHDKIDPRSEFPGPTGQTDDRDPADDLHGPRTLQRAPSAEDSTLSQVNDSDREQDEESLDDDPDTTKPEACSTAEPAYLGGTVTPSQAFRLAAACRRHGALASVR